MSLSFGEHNTKFIFDDCFKREFGELVFQVLNKLEIKICDVSQIFVNDEEIGKMKDIFEKIITIDVIKNSNINKTKTNLKYLEYIKTKNNEIEKLAMLGKYDPAFLKSASIIINVLFNPVIREHFNIHLPNSLENERGEGGEGEENQNEDEDENSNNLRDCNFDFEISKKVVKVLSDIQFDELDHFIKFDDDSIINDSSLINDGSSLICVICLSDYKKNKKCVKLKCNHSFHTECAREWLTKKDNKCPLCKDEYKKGILINF